MLCSERSCFIPVICATVIAFIVIISCVWICCRKKKKPHKHITPPVITNGNNAVSLKKSICATPTVREECEYDFHGFTVPKSLKTLEEILRQKQNEYRNQRSHFSVKIITGWGKHSKGHKPRVRPAVINHLDNKGYSYDDTTYSGAVLVFIPPKNTEAFGYYNIV